MTKQSLFMSLILCALPCILQAKQAKPMSRNAVEAVMATAKIANPAIDGIGQETKSEEGAENRKCPLCKPKPKKAVSEQDATKDATESDKCYFCQQAQAPAPTVVAEEAAQEEVAAATEETPEQA